MIKALEHQVRDLTAQIDRAETALCALNGADSERAQAAANVTALKEERDRLKGVWSMETVGEWRTLQWFLMKIKSWVYGFAGLFRIK